MSSIGEKIKEALTGHSHKDSGDSKDIDETTPRSYPSDEKKVIEGQTNLSKLGHQHNDNEIGAGHTQGRHDPEVDAKEATSQAGNYPYWGDIPRKGEQGHTQQSGMTALGGGHGGDSHNLTKGSGLAAGALATGAGTTASGSRGSEYEHRPLGTQDTTSTTQNFTDRTRDTGLTSSTQDPSTTQSSRDGHKGEIAAATGAGLAGATYLGTRHKDEDNKNTRTTTTSGLASGPTQAGPGSLDPGYASQTSSSTTRPQEVSNNAFGDSRYGTQDNTTSHRKEEGALAAGAAGLGGAGYLAHKRHEDNQSRTNEQPTSATGSSQQRAFGLTSSGNDNPQTTTTRGDNSHFKEDAALAGAGAAGLGGAGYLAHRQNENQTRADERSTTAPSTQQREPTTTGGGIHNTVIGAGSGEDTHSRTHKSAFDSTPLSPSNTTTVGPQHGRVDPREQQTISSSLGAPSSGNDRERQGLAAAAGVGAGAGVVAAEEKHRHRDEHRQHDDDQTKNQGHSVFGSSGHHQSHDKHNQPTQAATSTTSPQPSAQLAAQQAWNKQNQTSSGGLARHDPESEARQATSAAGNYPYEGGDRATSNVGGQQPHHHHNAALGAAGAGLAGAGATAAYYGQGREHDQNPRSDESQKIADRALGSDGAAHAPTSTQGQSGGLTGLSSTTPGYGQSSSGLSGSSGLGSSKVLHKCHQCGADNDISDYFKKDAAFRSGN